VRDRITVAADASDDEIIAAAKAAAPIAKALADKPVKRAIVVRGRLVNLIV
jgi:leucyl-tRNA synthetase